MQQYSTHTRLKRTFGLNKIFSNLNFSVTLPQFVFDIDQLKYTIETLLWQFCGNFNWNICNSTKDQIILSLSDHCERKFRLDLRKVRDAFETICGKREVNLPRDSLQRINEEVISQNYSVPELSRLAWRIVTALTDIDTKSKNLNPKLTIFLTHDVDRANPYDPVGLLRRFMIPTRGIPNKFTARFWDFIQWIKNANKFLDVYRTIMRKEHDAGAIATYFFMSGPYSLKKIGARTGWCVKNKRLHEIIQIAEHFNHRIGIHGCAYSLQNNDYERQRIGMSETIGREVTWHRNHYLVWDPEKSPKALKKAGLKFDSTLGCNTLQAFRRGLAWPYEIWDIERNQPSGVIEIPLVFMDSASFNESNNFVWKELDRQLDIVESVCGQVAVNFHLDYFVKNLIFIDGYLKLLESLVTRGANLASAVNEDHYKVGRNQI